MTEITQADWDAGLDLLSRHFSPPDRPITINIAAEAFARHRQQAIEALQADKAKMREALRVYAGPMEWSEEPYWGAFPVWADGYPGGVYIDENTLDFGEAARAALQETER